MDFTSKINLTPQPLKEKIVSSPFLRREEGRGVRS